MMIFKFKNIFWVVLAVAVAVAGRLWFGGRDEPVAESGVVPVVERRVESHSKKSRAVKRRRRAVAAEDILSEDNIAAEDVISGDPQLGKTPADAIPGEYLFRFYSDADRKAFEKYAREHGVTIIDSMRVGNTVRIGVSDRSILADLLRNGPVAVDWMPNIYIDVPKRIEGSNPLAPRGGYTAFGNQALAWLGVDADAGRGAGITVAVLDSGVTAAGALDGYSIETLDLTGELGGDTAHGTAVAAIIAGSDSDSPGVAPGARLISVKVLSEDGRGDAFTLAKGIVEAVDRGANIINMSLGSHSDSFILQQAVAYAVERNVLLVAATGNDAKEGVLFPARYKDVMAVAAVDFNNEHLYFSNRGDEVDLAAPGAGVAVMIRDGDERDLFSGTSAASPFVTGAAAAIWARDHSLSPQDVKDLLIGYSNDAGAPGVDKFFGAGGVNLGRVLQRNEPGICDMAAMMPNVVNSARGVHIDISAQNRGTEILGEVRLDVDINGNRQSFCFFNVAPGATISQPFNLGVAGEGFEIKFAAVPVGVQDATPGNNGVISRISRQDSE